MSASNQPDLKASTDMTTNSLAAQIRREMEEALRLRGPSCLPTYPPEAIASALADGVIEVIDRSEPSGRPVYALTPEDPFAEPTYAGGPVGQCASCLQEFPLNGHGEVIDHDSYVLNESWSSNCPGSLKAPTESSRVDLDVDPDV